MCPVAICTNIALNPNCIFFPEVGDCDDGWLNYDEMCYYFSSDKVSFDAAKQQCETLNSSMTSVLNAEEHAFLVDKR